MLGPSDNPVAAIDIKDSLTFTPSCSTGGYTKYNSHFGQGFLSNSIGGHSLGMEQYPSNHVNDFGTVSSQNLVPQSSNKYNAHQKKIEQQAIGQTPGMNSLISKLFEAFEILSI